MIQLTRLRHEEPFFVNHDHIERVDTHVDTVVRLANGTEFVVVETGTEIVHRIAEFRARVLALASVLRQSTISDSETPEEATHGDAPLLLLDPPSPAGQHARSIDWDDPADDDPADDDPADDDTHDSAWAPTAAADAAADGADATNDEHEVVQR